MVLAILLALLAPVQAALQFDVFLGYGGLPTGSGGVIREAGWFSVGCEVFNDGPGFDAVFEVSSDDGDQVWEVPVELPTNTRKRFTLPVYHAGTMHGRWSARLRDDRGRVRAEYLNVRPAFQSWEGVLLGAVPRTPTGLPVFPKLQQNLESMQPTAARIPVEFLPDNPIALEGLNGIYLNSDRLAEIKPAQSDALLAWLHHGGHLILAVEQPGEVQAAGWLAAQMPGRLTGMTNLKLTPDLTRWVGAVGESAKPLAPDAQGILGGMGPGASKSSLDRPWSIPRGSENPYSAVSLDPGMTEQELAVCEIRMREGRVETAIGNQPLVVSVDRGRGRLTVLLFSPEREPFRSWSDKGWFWARLMRVPPEWFTLERFDVWSGQGLDGVYGAMIDSRQVRKLPVSWLVMLLVVYLVAIGPFDRYVLKRLNRQMLTWVTFPAYVALFSLLIYYIGYRLRAGETECNELSVVDVLHRPQDVMLRGRTYVSIYSPVNASYALGSEQSHASLRREHRGPTSGSGSGGAMRVQMRDRGFVGQVEVPVWTSQLFVSDWWQDASAPIEVGFVQGSGGVRASVTNRLDAPLESVRVVVQGELHDMGPIPAGQSRDKMLQPGEGRPLADLVQDAGQRFERAVQARGRAFGSSQSEWLDLESDNLTGASFAWLWGRLRGQDRLLVFPQDDELTPMLDRRSAIVLAWAPGYQPAAPTHRFEARRTKSQTWLRLAVPLPSL